MLDVYLYAFFSVLTISICGLVPIICMPRLQKTRFQNDLLQFLIGLAIGTLTADALLHLLPISSGTLNNINSTQSIAKLPATISNSTPLLSPNKSENSTINININQNNNHEHHHGFDHDDDHHEHHHHGHNHGSGEGFWFGMMALIGIIGFLILERCMVLVTDIFAHDGHVQTPTIEEDQSKGTQINVTTTNHNNNNDNNTNNSNNNLHNQSIPEAHVHIHHDHQHQNHHQHQHHHLNSKTQSFMFMIITGDGLHNFFDGIAIGVSYNSGLAVGLSTSIAILCHELPHEIGDFAVLIKNGMTIRRAVLYNTLSSVLCLLGAITGVFIGRIDVGWVSALIAGMFLYISLVDMVPQLNCYPTQPIMIRVKKLLVQIAGILLGVTIMSMIALHESSLHSLLTTYNKPDH